jgi:3-dehydro-L-gulonate 2-dehydrogenase
MRVTYDELKNELKRVLLKLSFPENKAELCASVFAANSRDGVYSHGLSRFPVFAALAKEGLIDTHVEPECVETKGNFEIWDGHLGPGIYNATLCMERAIKIAKESGVGVIAIRNTNHWMRGGTYGWQAADAGCIGICFTNASAGMPPWGGDHPTLGNNPLVIAVPRKGGHVVLDMAMSQYSYGKLGEYQFKNEPLPVPGGYDEHGNLTTDPASIIKTKRALPVGYWKGSGLSLLIDILLTSLSGGNSTAQIAEFGKEVGLSQCFICIQPRDIHSSLIEKILLFTKTDGDGNIREGIAFPGENTLERRKQNEKDGIPINEKIWNDVLKM